MNWDARRMVGALDELIQAESIALRARNVSGAARAQRRASPLIVALKQADGAGAIPDSLRPKLREIAERRQQNLLCLAEMKARCWSDLERLRTTRRRVAGLKPYGGRKPKATFILRG